MLFQPGCLGYHEKIMKPANLLEALYAKAIFRFLNILLGLLRPFRCAYSKVQRALHLYLKALKPVRVLPNLARDIEELGLCNITQSIR